MQLFVIKDYKSRQIHYEKGQVLEVTMEQAAFLKVDAPGCFSLKAPEKPPADKMLRKGKTK
jgi:hypothetical protein